MHNIRQMNGIILIPHEFYGQMFSVHTVFKASLLLKPPPPKSKAAGPALTFLILWNASVAQVCLDEEIVERKDKAFNLPFNFCSSRHPMVPRFEQ